MFQEEKAEIKAQNYLLEKEKKALELRLSGKESREQAYLVQIEHLKSEVLEHSTRGSRDSSPFAARVSMIFVLSWYCKPIYFFGY